jgi:DNA relaxase NicK
VSGQDGRLGIGWAQGTTRATSAADMLGWLGERFGPSKAREHGVQWYCRAWSVGDRGVVVASEPRSASSDPAEVYVVVPQGALDALGWDGQIALLALLDALGVRLSRVDVYYDDLARLADPEDVLAALRGGDTRTRVKSWRRVEDSAGGMTAYLGARSGECMIRVYRKWAESGDPAAGVRWEMEAKGERAPIVAEFVRLSAAPAVAFFGLLRAFCDFVDREDGARGSRSALLGWWSALVGSAERAVYVGAVVVNGLAKRAAWFRRACAPTLAVLFAALGSDAIDRMMRDAWEAAPWALAGTRHLVGVGQPA